MSDKQREKNDFKSLSLSNPILEALDEIGYETPSPIQAAIIPAIKAGSDVVGQAQTGTGKTAAFALPLLSKIDTNSNHTQVMVLTPTRELAIQVAEAFQSYASKMKGFHVLPVYGGQNYSHQLKQLKRGVHVVVGTPGRIMDHMRRKTLKLDKLDCLVLDEADEMLRMGFIDDVEWVLDQIPKKCQIALLSATMPNEIRKIAHKYLKDPKEITIKTSTVTAPSITQRFWSGPQNLKLDVLTRILEHATFDAVIIFVRTKLLTSELKEKLEARGFNCDALNGDIQQNQREKIIDSFKKGRSDILIATDVAARGLDVERITHVVNYDIPYDTEAYTHRIGRTGRAGRKGEAILFVTPREVRLLRAIERSTKQPIEPIKLPSAEELNSHRIQKLKDTITHTLESDLGIYLEIAKSYSETNGTDPIETAAAALKLAQGKTPLLLKELKTPKLSKSDLNPKRTERGDRGDRGDRGGSRSKFSSKSKEGMETYQIELGHNEGIKPGNIVGAIANEAKINSSQIGAIRIFDDHSHVDLPTDFPTSALKMLSKARVMGHQLKLTPIADATSHAPKSKDAAKKRTRKPTKRFKKSKA